MGFIDIEKWPRAAITGIVGLTLTVGVAAADLPRGTIVLRDGKIIQVSKKKTDRAEHPIHAPGTLSSVVSSTSGSSLHFVAVADLLEYTPGIVSARVAADLATVAKQPFLFPPEA